MSTLHVFSQLNNYTLARTFTIADGLPSNHVYTCTEDKQGFLWISTDAGIARFDGKNFQVFTSKQGLPDDDVLEVVKENCGRIWVNCFKQSPAYFDESKNLFVNAKQDSNLGKVNGTSLMNLYALSNGGVMYNNEKGSYFFDDHEFSLYNFPLKQNFNVVVKRLIDGRYIALVNDFDSKIVKLMLVKGRQIVASINLVHNNDFMQLNYVLNDNKIYFWNEKSDGIYIISNIQSDTLRCDIDSMDLKMKFTWLGVNNKYISVIFQTGESIIYDKRTKDPLTKFPAKNSINSIFHDSKGNIWLSTIDRGIGLYKKKRIEIMPIPADFTNTYFLSIARKPGGSVFAGNYFGEVIETGAGNFNVHKLPDQGSGRLWQRKIILSQNKVYTFGEGGSFYDFRVPSTIQSGEPSGSKTAAVYNDSMLVVGGFNSLKLINTKTNEVVTLKGVNKRTTALCTTAEPMIYHGSTDGLYKFDVKHNTDFNLTAKNPLLSESITALCATDNGMVWVGTSSNGVLQLRNDSLINVFSKANGLISNNIKCIISPKQGEIWVGTNNGISIIHYLKPYFESISVCDGLSSNIINDMAVSGDSVYCATANGISVVPVLLNLPTYDIDVKLTGIRINNKETVLDSFYRLGYYDNFLQLNFAGIELGGHFNFLEYQVNSGPWNKMDGNTLELILNSGKHKVAVRAVNMNWQHSRQSLQMNFSVATPFWKYPLLWLAAFFLSSALFVWWFRKKESAKREISLQGMLNQKRLIELELQALKSQIDPHFIFNCLNSIKSLNHKKQYNVAEIYLDHFAALLRSALEQSALNLISLQQEINFINNYLSLEKLRFPNRMFYKIDKDSNIEAGSLFIPSMLLQPYIENSIKHGIGPLQDRQGIITIRFRKEQQFLIAEVEDNGIGITAGTANAGVKGIGLMNTQRRCSLWNIEFHIKDIHNKNMQVCGTVITLLIPLSLHPNKTHTL